MNVTITPQRLCGTVLAPPSKSVGHRALICAHLGGGSVRNLGNSKDISATQNALLQMEAGETMDCGESGSTLRFLIPLALARKGGGTFCGQGRLMQRPLDVYEALFAQKGIALKKEGGKLTVSGRLQGGVYPLRGDVSSQFVTGLLFALPLLEKNSEIVMTTPLESRPYVDITLDVLARFGIKIENKNYESFFIKGGQRYAPCDFLVEGDFSQAAFFLAAALVSSVAADVGLVPGQTATAGTLDGNVEILGLPACSAQGDKEILTLVERFGGKVVRKGETVWACGENLHGIDIDVSQIPDLVPPLAVIALAAKGKTRLYNAARLRMKESDRLSALAQQFCALRASIAEGPDFLEIDGGAPLCGGVVSACNDHRIAMAVAVASQMAAGEVTVLGAECVEKSYPDFWDVFRKIGGKLHE